MTDVKEGVAIAQADVGVNVVVAVEACVGVNAGEGCEGDGRGEEHALGRVGRVGHGASGVRICSAVMWADPAGAWGAGAWGAGPPGTQPASSTPATTTAAVRMKSRRESENFALVYSPCGLALLVTCVRLY